MQILGPSAELAQHRSQRAGGQLSAAGRHHRKSATEACHHMPALSAVAIDFDTEAAKPTEELTTRHA
jgi:hypothetical protein